MTHLGYKTIMTVLTDVDQARDQLHRAASFASASGAHLSVVALGVDHTHSGHYHASAAAVVLQEAWTRAHEEADMLEELARSTLAGQTVTYGIERTVSLLSDVGLTVAHRARFVDLVLLPAPYVAPRRPEMEPALEGALFEGAAPVLVMPTDGPLPPQPENIVVAWDEGLEALAATRAALPMLSAAERVHVTLIAPPRHGLNRSDPGGRLAEFLARHGVRAEIDVLARTLPRVSDVLQRHCRDVEAELVVMGAYGHSRLREAILGGATRDMLESAALPVLMVH